jgi:transposase
MISKDTPIKSYSRKELAYMYGVSRKTFSKWIRKLDMKYKRLFTPKEVRRIFELLGEP